MLNWIWAGLIASSLLFAVGYDVRDLSRDTYRNGQALEVELAYPEGYDPEARQVPVRITLQGYDELYGTSVEPAEPFDGYLVQTEGGRMLRFDAGASFPEPLATIAGVSKSNDDELQGSVVTLAEPVAPPPVAPPVTGDSALALAPPAETTEQATGHATIRFEQVRFLKLQAITQAAFDLAETAAGIAIGLVGILALFLGLLKIAEAAGIVFALVKLVRPLLRPLFPEIPPDHPAFGMIALNITANVFGLGNAATPFGIKAMEELQKLNPTTDTATNPMVMFLAINTASVQLVPPVLLLALLGLQINELIFPIILTTFLGLLVAIVAVKLYGRLPSVRASDPNLHPPGDVPAAEV